MGGKRGIRNRRGQRMQDGEEEAIENYQGIPDLFVKLDLWEGSHPF